MIWTKVRTMHEPPGAGLGDWVSGIYKIERYEQSIHPLLERGTPFRDLLFSHHLSPVRQLS